MEGQLNQHPLAELIREVIDKELSGALRVARAAAKVAVYFDAGTPIFAASNLRAHRLREILKRNKVAVAQLNNFPARATDEELANGLITGGHLNPEVVQKLRATQAADVLRVALLWTDGEWKFDPRVRIPAEMRAELDMDRMLLESARHLPFAFIKTRLHNATAEYSLGSDIDATNLLPAESFVLYRAVAIGSGLRLADLSANGLSDEDHIRGVYALSLSGMLRSDEFKSALSIKRAAKPQSTSAAEPAVVKEQTATAVDSVDVEGLFARLDTANDYYDVLDVPRGATPDEVKDAYHTLARQFHPDRFHQDDEDLRNRIGSAFARIAQAYETLGDATQRTAYDKRRGTKSTDAASRKSEVKKETPATPSKKGTSESRAEVSFKNGMDALERNQIDEAVRLLAEAASLEPREARYRANYAQALIHRPNSRRIAETELQAAVALEPNNSSFRVMLAELYQRIGLRRRAEGEAARALAIDPGNQAARALLSSLKK
jgi:curved DNA-binding protein CbpA